MITVDDVGVLGVEASLPPPEPQPANAKMQTAVMAVAKSRMGDAQLCC